MWGGVLQHLECEAEKGCGHEQGNSEDDVLWEMDTAVCDIGPWEG
jgi:hypothetical protein